MSTLFFKKTGQVSYTKMYVLQESFCRAERGGFLNQRSTSRKAGPLSPRAYCPPSSLSCLRSLLLVWQFKDPLGPASVSPLRLSGRSRMQVHVAHVRGVCTHVRCVSTQTRGHVWGGEHARVRPMHACACMQVWVCVHMCYMCMCTRVCL